MSVAEVTTIPAVVHADMLSTLSDWCTEMLPAAVVVAVAPMNVPGVSATISRIEMRESEVEIVAVRIAGIDGEVPVASVPIQRAVEVVGCQEGFPLPVEEDIAQVEVTALPVGAEDIAAACHSHQVVEIDFIRGLILLVGEVELIGHLIGQEQSLVAGLLVTHCVGVYCYRQHCHQGHHHLFHRRRYLIVRHHFCMFTVQRNDFFCTFTKEIP